MTQKVKNRLLSTFFNYIIYIRFKIKTNCFIITRFVISMYKHSIIKNVKVEETIKTT